MSLAEEYGVTPQILHIGDDEPDGMAGHVERVTGEQGLLDNLGMVDCVTCEHTSGYDALAFLDTVREHDASLPFLVLTGDEEVIRDTLDAGATDCVRPESRQLLTHRIRMVVNYHRNQQALTQAESLLEEIPNATVMTNQNGTIEQVSDEIEQLLGYESDALVGAAMTTLLPERLRDERGNELSRYFERDERDIDCEYIETVAEHRDGHEIPVSLSFAESDSDREVVGIVRDISARKTVETKLESLRERYQKLIETSPEAILVADAETGSIVDANPAAETLFGRSHDEILNMHQSELHPPEQREFYRRLFDRTVETGGIKKKIRNLKIVRPDGETVPVEISSNMTRVGERRIVHGIFKDVSERKKRERTLNSLHSATRELMSAETKSEICEIAASVVGETLGLPISGIHLANAEGTALHPTAVTETTEKTLDEIPTFEAGNSLAWSVFESGEREVFHDPKNEPDAHNQETPIGREIVLPLGDHGVFLLGKTATDEFEDYVLDFAEILAANVQSALDRAEREETLSTHREELEELNRINAVIRDVDRALVRATTREEIETTVSERLASAEPYQLAWVGKYNAGRESVSPVASSGDDCGDEFLESTVRPTGEVQGPATKALETETVVVVENVATDPAFEPWREESLDRGYRSLAAIPILYDETCYGVLVVHANRANAFDERERAVLAELGEAVGLAIAGIESRKALVSDSVVEVEMESTDANHFFVELAREMECELRLAGTTLSADGSLLCFITVSGVSSEAASERFERVDSIADVRVVHENDDECVVEFRYEKPNLVTTLAERGGSISRAEADEDGAHGVVELPTDANVRRMVATVREVFSDAQVVAQRERDNPEPTITGFRATLDESLTDRQWTALKTAYLAGFFEWPRASTGEEVAASLDVTSPTFHQHLRRAQSKLVGTFFDQ